MSGTYKARPKPGLGGLGGLGGSGFRGSGRGCLGFQPFIFLGLGLKLAGFRVKRGSARLRMPHPCRKYPSPVALQPFRCTKPNRSF